MVLPVVIRSSSNSEFNLKVLVLARALLLKRVVTKLDKTIDTEMDLCYSVMLLKQQY